MPSTDTKPELTAKASMAQPVSQPAVYALGLKNMYGVLHYRPICCDVKRLAGTGRLLRHEYVNSTSLTMDVVVVVVVMILITIIMIIIILPTQKYIRRL
jgi:hypothetical protein